MTFIPPAGSCQSIHADQITGEDLARALPVFARIPRDTVIANSPPPGSQRIFATPELERIGRPYGADVLAKSKVCFEWEMRTLTSADVGAAIRESLGNEKARIDVLDFSKGKAPEGKLVFPLSGLSASTNVDATTPVTWRGEVIYGGGVHKFTVWARVRMMAATTRAVARVLLLPGQPVTVDGVRLETVDDFPLRRNVIHNLEEVVGKAPLRPIRPGAPILDSDLVEPLEVRRGESVLVTAIAGGAQLRMEAVAENSGRRGDMVSLRNPRSGNSFRARVDGRDQAVVIAGPVTLLAGVQ